MAEGPAQMVLNETFIFDEKAKFAQGHHGWSAEGSQHRN